VRSYSPFLGILPYLGEIPLYSAYNFDVPVGDDPAPIHGPAPENETVGRSSLTQFLCPSDPRNPASPGTPGGPTNYRYSYGPAYYRLVADAIGPRPLNEGRDGAFTQTKALSPGAFSDGLSATAFVSEKLRGGDATRYQPHTDFWHSRALPQSSSELIDACRALRGGPQGHSPWTGGSWLIPNQRFSAYSHEVPPNSPIPDCAVAWDDMINASVGCITARSFHSGGVNVLFGDGRVAWTTNGVHARVWRAAGTRSGADSSVEAGP
jgi:prepilin-type processing-associated H-X9-DG protein